MTASSEGGGEKKKKKHVWTESLKYKVWLDNQLASAYICDPKPDGVRDVSRKYTCARDINHHGVTAFRRPVFTCQHLHPVRSGLDE